MATLRPNWFLISPVLIASGACSAITCARLLIPILAVEPSINQSRVEASKPNLNGAELGNKWDGGKILSWCGVKVGGEGRTSCERHVTSRKWQARNHALSWHHQPHLSHTVSHMKWRPITEEMKTAPRQVKSRHDVTWHDNVEVFGLPFARTAAALGPLPITD
jgi:hypothetical protein